MKVDFVSRQTGLTKTQIQESVKKLEQNEIVRLTDVAVTPASRPRIATDGRTDVTNVRNETGHALAKARAAPANLVPVYCDAFKKRYGSSPTITKRDAGQLQGLVKSLGFEKASYLIQVYLQIDDPWFKKKYHDLRTFFGNLNQISVALASGKSPAVLDWDVVFGREKKSDSRALQTRN